MDTYNWRTIAFMSNLESTNSIYSCKRLPCLWPITNNASLNILVHLFWLEYAFNFVEHIPKEQNCWSQACTESGPSWCNFMHETWYTLKKLNNNFFYKYISQRYLTDLIKSYPVEAIWLLEAIWILFPIFRQKCHQTWKGN